MKIVSHGLNKFGEAGKYGCATAEYTGLVSYSYLKRGGNVVAKITSPVTSVVFRPFAYIRDRTSKVLGRVALDPEVLRGLEEKIMRIEERLALIEKRGVGPAERRVSRKKKLDEGKREVLQMIVQENLLLREAG